MAPIVVSANNQSDATYALHDFVRVLWKRRGWIIGSIVICVLLAVAQTLRTTRTYQATTTIELNKGAGGLELGLGDPVSQQLTGGTDLQTDLQTETVILKGDSLALAVIQRLNLASQPRFGARPNKAGKLSSEQGVPLEDAPQTRTQLLGIFGAHLTVKPIRGTRLIQVTYESDDPKQASQIANALIESYKGQYLKSHFDATSEASEWLTKQLSDLKANVEDSAKKLTDYERENGILSLDVMTGSGGGGSNGGGGGGGIHSVVIEKLDALNAELTVAEANRIEKEAIYRLAQSGSADVVIGLGKDPLAVQGNSMVLTQGGGISALQQLEQQKSQLKISLADTATMYGENNRHLKEMQTQMSALDEQIAEEMRQIGRRAQGDFQLAKETESAIRKQFEQQQAEAAKLNEKAVQFAVLSQEATSRKKLYEDLYTKLQEANVSAGIKATNITIVDPARAQSSPFRPKPVTNLAIGTLLGIFVGLFSSFIADNFDRTVTSPREVERITGKPVIGMIPAFGETIGRYGLRTPRTKRKAMEAELPVLTQAWMMGHPNSYAAEAFRALRTSVMLSRARHAPKIILVTSCVPGEGKTTVTSNLAVTFAQYNKKVIIIEADLRRPRMKLSAEANLAGLSSVLSGEVKSDKAIVHRVHMPTLDILPAGPHPPMPSEILGSVAFDELLEQLSSHYDISVIESPPVLLVTDAVIISTKADAVLWVMREGVTTRPQLARAAELIERNGMPVIGFVINRISSESSDYGYKYRDSYYGEKKQNDA